MTPRQRWTHSWHRAASRSILPRVLYRLLWDAARLALLLGAILAAPSMFEAIFTAVGGTATGELRDYMEISRPLASWALLALAPFALAHLAALRFPTVGRIVRLPRLLLLTLGASYVILAGEGVLATAFAFDGSHILLAAIVAHGLAYLAGVVRRAAAETETRLPGGSVPTRAVAGGSDLAASAAAACAGAVLVWGTLAALPRLSATLLDDPSTEYFGRSSLDLFGHLFEGRHLLAGLIVVFVMSRWLPSAIKSASLPDYDPLARAVTLTLLGAAIWTVGAYMVPLGQGFLLLGAVIAAGLFSLALSQIARYARHAPSPLMSDIAKWLSDSTVRGFAVGASLACYALFLRPLFYGMLWFAPIFEWLVVLTISLVFLSRIRSRVGSGPETSEPAAWTSWERHRQTVEDIPDARFETILGFQRRFIESGEWRLLWRYFLELMYRNEAPLQAIQAAFRPMRRCFVADSTRRFWQVGLPRSRELRETALSETLHGIKAALSSPPAPLKSVDEPQLVEAGEPFVREGGEPDSLAATLIAGYWQGGASLNQAIGLWFPLMTFVDSSARWFELPRARTRVRRRNRERRQEMVSGAVAHLFGREDQGCLRVAIPDRGTAVFSKPIDTRANPVRNALTRGCAVEIISEDRSGYMVRAPDDVEGYVAKRDLVRQPVLPGDNNGQ